MKGTRFESEELLRRTEEILKKISSRGQNIYIYILIYLIYKIYNI